MPHFDSWIKKQGGMPRRLIRPSHMNPGDRLFRIWKSFKAHAHDVVRKGSMEFLEMGVEVSYRDAYVEACPSEEDKNVARAEVKYNMQLVNAWCVYTECHDHLDMCGWDKSELITAKTWMEEQLELLRDAEDILRGARHIRDSCPIDVRLLRIRIPVLTSHCLCGSRAMYRFEGNGWSEKMCAPCYHQANSESSC